MNKELLLLRHGKSDWNQDVDDFHRPLKSKGKRAAQKIGLWLAQQALVPELIISSPAERAINTAKKAAKLFHYASHAIQQNEQLYMATPDEILEVIHRCPETVNRLMLVGHNPGIEELVYQLAGNSVKVPDDGKLVPTATLAIFHFEGNWQHCNTVMFALKEIIRARELPEGFPYPDLNSRERRERPAYYYRQSAVIPYRWQGEKLEILIIRTNGNNHWVFPKGIVDPELTPAASAEKEAFEEAGVKGKVDLHSLGHYHVNKWGAQCRVEIFPMRVEDVIPETHRKESHRKRLWVDVSALSQYIKDKTLLDLVKSLSQYLGAKR